MSNKPVPREPQATPGEDIRVAAIGKIWGSAIPLFALSIALAFFVKLVYLPLAIMIGLVMATCVVWYGKKDSSRDAQLEALRERVNALEDRLHNVETLSRVELEMVERNKP